MTEFEVYLDVIEGKNFPGLQELIRRGVPIDSYCPLTGQGPIHIAAYCEFPEGLSAILDADADIDAPDYDGITALFIGTDSGDTETVKLLLGRGANPVSGGSYGTPLTSAARLGRPDMIKLILDALIAREHATAPSLPPPTPKEVDSAIQLMAEQHCTDCALKTGSNELLYRALVAGTYQRSDEHQQTGFTYLPLFGTEAVHYSDEEDGPTIDDLDNNAHDDDDDQMVEPELKLWAAVLREDENDVATRLAADDNVNLVGNERQCTPLIMASSLGHAGIVRRLVAAGAQLDATDISGATALIYAAANNHTEAMSTLLGAGADADVVDNNCCSAMTTAAISGHVEAVHALVAGGARGASHCLERVARVCADAPIRNVKLNKVLKVLTGAGATVDGATAKISPLIPSDVIRAIVPENTPFWLAANNDAPMLAAELAGGLDPNTKTENGMTLLHWACAGDAPECVQLLLDAGANVDETDDSDDSSNYSYDSDDFASQIILQVIRWTPLFYCMHDTPATADLLLRHRANVIHTCNDETPLHYAVASNAATVVTRLVKALDFTLDATPVLVAELLCLCFSLETVPGQAAQMLLAGMPEDVLKKATIMFIDNYCTLDRMKKMAELWKTARGAKDFYTAADGISMAVAKLGLKNNSRATASQEIARFLFYESKK